MRQETRYIVRRSFIFALLGLWIFAGVPGMAQGGHRSQHYFLTQGGDVVQVYTGALEENVTTSAGGPLTSGSGTPLTSYAIKGDTEYLYFIAAGQHVSEFYYSGSNWTYYDLTTETAGPLAATSSALTSFYDGGHHVLYEGANQHVYHLYYNTTLGYWVDDDNTSLAGGPLAATGSALTSYGVTGGSEYVYFIGSNQHVGQLYYSGSKWAYYDLTAETGGALAATSSSLTSFYDTFGHHVFYVGANQHVYQLYYNPSVGHWVDNDNTALAGASPAVSGTGLTSFSDKADYYYGAGGEHLFYVSLETNGGDCYGGQPCLFVTELLYNGSSWISESIGLGDPPPLTASAITSLPGYDDGSGDGIDFEQVVLLETPGTCGTDNLEILEYIPGDEPPWFWGGCNTAVSATASLTSFIDP